MHNFRKFKDVEINFPEGIIGLIGNNGTGKSTIIEAIGWAIYGNRASRTTKEQIKRQGAGKHEDCWVKLVFELGGNTYEVFRIISGNSTDARVKVNGLIAASTSQKVTEFLEKRIGMDYDSFYTSIVAKQQELNALSDKSPSERKKSMLRMLKIDLLEEAIKRVREDRRNKERILEYIEKNLKDLDELEKEKDVCWLSLNEHIKRRNQLMEELKEIERELKEVDEKRKKEKEKAEKYKELIEKKNLLGERKKNKTALLNEKIGERGELYNKKDEYEKIKNAIYEFDELNKKKEEIEELREKYYERKNLIERIKLLEKEIIEINNKVEELREKLRDEEKTDEAYKSILKEIDELEKFIKEAEKTYQAKIAERNAIFDKRAETIDKLMKIEKLGPQSNCPTCGRLLGDKYEEIVTNFKREIKEMEDKIRRLKELLPIKNKAIILENEIKKLPSLLKDIEELTEEIKYIEKEIENCLKEIELLKFDEEEYKEMERKYEEIKNKFFGKREEIIRIESKIESIKKDIDRLEKEIEEQKKQREKIKDLRKEITYLEMLAGDRDTGLLNKFKSYLIAKIGPLLSYYASHFFNIFTDGKYKEIEIDDNYDIYIYDRGEKFQLNRFSGGEKDLANLSLRLAISQLIAQRADISLNFIALDEIFGSQDRERRKNVLNALAELKKQFKQIILITHIEEIKDSLEHIIKVYEDENGISYIKEEKW